MYLDVEEILKMVLYKEEVVMKKEGRTFRKAFFALVEVCHKLG